MVTGGGGGLSSIEQVSQIKALAPSWEPLKFPRTWMSDPKSDAAMILVWTGQNGVSEPVMGALWADVLFCNPPSKEWAAASVWGCSYFPETAQTQRRARGRKTEGRKLASLAKWLINVVLRRGARSREPLRSPQQRATANLSRVSDINCHPRGSPVSTGRLFPRVPTPQKLAPVSGFGCGTCQRGTALRLIQEHLAPLPVFRYFFPLGPEKKHASAPVRS